MASTMTHGQAQTLRAAYDGAIKQYTKMTKTQLSMAITDEMADRGVYRVFGHLSKDELIAGILDLRGYTVAKLNEAIHVIAHDPRWPDCPHCQAELAAVARVEAQGRQAAVAGEDGLTEYIPDLTPDGSAFVPSGTGWPAT